MANEPVKGAFVMNSTLALLESRYLGALLVKPTEAGRLLNQSRQSTYNQVCAGRFPISLVVDHLNRKMVRLIDLANYIDGMAAVIKPLQPPEPRKNDLPKGRPIKVEQVEARMKGFASVADLRLAKATIRQEQSANHDVEVVATRCAGRGV